MRRAAGARGAEGERPRLRLRDQLLQRARRHRGVRNQDQRRIAELGDGREIAQGVERDLREHVGIDHHRTVEAEHQRVAVGRAPRDLLGADVARCARAVLDHHRLAEACSEPVGDGARARIGDAAGGKGHDQPQRPGRESLPRACRRVLRKGRLGRNERENRRRHYQSQHELFLRSHSFAPFRAGAFNSTPWLRSSSRLAQAYNSGRIEEQPPLMLDFAEYVKIFVALLVIVNPIGTMPMFLGLTHRHSVADKKRIARVASISVAIVLTVSAVVGEHLLGFFGITIASFRVGGAILILLLAISMMHAATSGERQTPEEAKEAEDKESVAVVPLAIPLLAGPGAISTTIIYAAQRPSLAHLAAVVACCLLVALTTWIALRAATQIGRRLGKIGINVVIRIMGLLLAAVAVEIFASGIVVLLPGLGK